VLSLSGSKKIVGSMKFPLTATPCHNLGVFFALL
jgi:hypothetical protein